MFSHARVAFDGRHLVLRADGANGHLWSYATKRETLTRLTSEWDNDFPVTGPDTKLVYLLSKGGSQSIVVGSTQGTSESRLLHQGASLQPASISPDGKWLAYAEYGETTGFDVRLLSLEGDSEPRELVATRYSEVEPAFSPDGEWLLYVSDESGRREVYLTRVDDSRAKWQVSTRGGANPTWNPDGREIFYRLDRWMLAVDIGLSAPPRIGRPRRLFEYDELRQGQARAYDVAPDGKRFVSVVRAEAEPPRLHVVLNWFDELGL